MLSFRAPPTWVNSHLRKAMPKIARSMGQIAHGILNAKDKTTGAGKSRRFAPAGQSTQFIVGATNAPDADLLQKSCSRESMERILCGDFQSSSRQNEGKEGRDARSAMGYIAGNSG